MIQGQLEPSCQQHALTSGKGHLLAQHPVLIPVLLFSGSVGLCAASFYADTLFPPVPLLAWLGVPAALLCLAAALVSGITGLLASIISILESIDRYRLRNRLHVATFPTSKGA